MVSDSEPRIFFSFDPPPIWAQVPPEIKVIWKQTRTSLSQNSWTKAIKYSGRTLRLTKSLE